MKLCTGTAAAVGGWLTSRLAFAQSSETVANPGIPVTQLDSVWPLVIRLAFTLGLVIAAIVATVWVLKRVTTRRWPGHTQNRPVRVLDRVHLAPKRSLDVVAVGERIILLGVTETGINFLTELSPHERESWTAPPGTPVAFKSLLGEARERMRQTFAQARAELPTAMASPVRAESPCNQAGQS